MTSDIKSSASGLAALVIFSVTLFLSASMMFAIQPMTGKMLLPLVGGTPAGWIVAMAFFQIMLLGGYLLAHVFSKLSARGHAVGYLTALGIGLVSLPLSLTEHAGRIASTTPAPHDIFIVLTFALALPFIAISATSSTIQRLFTTTSHKSAADPYFLYVASNIGSFCGLLLYPTVIEPHLSLSAQSKYLTFFYIGLIGFALICLFLSGKEKKTAQHKEHINTAPTTYRHYLEWMLLALVPSSLLLGVTFHITTDIMSIPMMWVLPLALYLLTFVIAFSKKPVIPLWLAQGLHPWAVFFTIVLAGIYKLTWLNNWPGVFFYLIVFFIVTLSCHLQLAARRPLDANSRHLTGFYLMMSVGGALGGIFNAFIAPVFSVRVIELPLMLVASLLLLPAIRKNSIPCYFIIAVLLLCAGMMGYNPPQIRIEPEEMPGISMLLIIGLICIALIAQKYTDVFKTPTLMSLTAVALLLSQFMMSTSNIMYSSRNFYGTIRILEKTVTEKNPFKQDEPPQEFKLRMLVHGTTTHGLQILEPEEYKLTPTAYFSPQGPVGDLFKSFEPKNVTVVGLGAGVMNCFNAPDRHFTFIEIDPDMVTAAQEYFTFLTDCKSASEPKIIVGDGRIEIGRMPDASIDLLVIDAFSSDSIPTHLLTREALEEYLQKLTPDGVMVFHVSNRYFKLDGLFASLAETLGLQNKYVHNPYLYYPLMTPSVWIALAKPHVNLDKLPAEKRWQNVKPGKTPYWTDDYTNMMSVVSFETHLANPDNTSPSP